MKKRYARILAATLSAAMVFTSAPVNFGGINTGVIEAQAAQATVAYTDDTLTQALRNALAHQSVKDEMTKVWDGSSVKTGATSATASSMAKAVKDALDALIDTSLQDGSMTITVTVTGGNKTDAGSYAATVDASCTESSGTINAEQQSITLKIAQKPIDITTATDLGNAYAVTATDAWLQAPAAGANYTYAMSSLKTLATSGAALVGNGVPSGLGYDMSAADWNAVRALGFGDKVKVTIKAENGSLSPVQLANYTTEGVDGVEIKESKVVISKEITIHKAARTKLDAKATLDDIDPSTPVTPLDENAVTASYEKGAASVTLDGDGKDLVELDRVLITLSDKTVTTNNAVRVKTKKTYDPKEYGGNGTGEALENGFEVTENALTWKYNSSDMKFYTTLKLTVSDKKIAQKDIVWPTALAAGQTITSGDDLTKVKLAETASSKFGTFTIEKAGKFASAKDTVYDVKFTPNAGVEVDATGDNNDINVSASNVKAAQINVTVAKKNIESADLALSLSKANSTVDYGTSYTAVDGNIIGKNTTSCDYAVKGVAAGNMGNAIPMGEQTITYTIKVKDADETAIDGASTVEKSVKVTVKKPEVKAEIAMNNTAGYLQGSAVANPVAPNATVELSAKLGYATTGSVKGFKINATTPAQLDVETAKLGDLNVFAGTSTLTYQWYKNGTELYNQKEANLTVDTSKLGTDEYYCEITLKVPSAATDAEKAAWEAIIPGGKITTAKQKVNVTNSTIGSITVVGGLTYGSIDATASVNATPAKDYTIASVEWYVNDAKGVKVCDIPAADTTLVDGFATAKIPANLDAATDYKLCAKVTATATGKETDIAIKEETLAIARKELDVKLIKPSFEKGKNKLVYGQMNKEVTFTTPDGADVFGTFEVVDPRVIQNAGTTNVDVRFVPNAKTLKNYSAVVAGDKWPEDFVANKKADFTLSIDIATVELTVKADDITIEAGGTVPTVGSYTVEGLCADDSEFKVGLEVTVKVDATKVDTTKAGSYEAITVEAKINTPGANYESTVVTVPGNVIVKAAAPVVTPAPTATPAPAVKAAKATVSVKAGKSVTLKVKNAPKGAKVSWSLDKKAKKALKVSKKGKVTVKKGAKKGTYKVYAKVNGKKVTFKVKVK